MAMAMPEYTSIWEADLDLILIGKTGSGKSAVGNSIIGEDAFNSSYNTTSITKYPQYAVTKFNGRIIQVVDCPGVLDTDIDKTNGKTLVKNAIQNAILTNPQGYHAFLVVVKYGNSYTEEEQEAIAILKHLLGKDCLRKYGIVVLTNGDTFEHNILKNGKTIDDYIEEEEGHFRKLLLECGKRIVVFDNITEKENVRRKQVNDLIDMVDLLDNSRSRYSSKAFNIAQEVYKKIFGDVGKPKINKQMLNAQCLFIKEVKNSFEKEKSVTLFLEIHVDLITFLETLRMKDKDTGELNRLILNVTQLIILIGKILHVYLQDNLNKSEASSTKDSPHDTNTQPSVTNNDSSEKNAGPCLIQKENSQPSDPVTETEKNEPEVSSTKKNQRCLLAFNKEHFNKEIDNLEQYFKELNKEYNSNTLKMLFLNVKDIFSEKVFSHIKHVLNFNRSTKTEPKRNSIV